MAMSYSTLVASKATAGSIASWCSYTLLDTAPILDEAQSLLYTMLRVREMRSMFSFRIPQGGASVALPARFLDPVGRIYSTTNMAYFRHLDETSVVAARAFAETSGTLGSNPFTTTAGSTQVTVALTAHGFNQDSSFYTTGGTAVGGLTLDGNYEIVTVATNSFVIDSKAATAATSSATGGGASASYVCDNLQQGFPEAWAVWDEKLKFDASFAQSQLCQLMYFQSLPLLSTSNETNFLTDRYPNLLRTATNAAAADFMQDSEEYTKQMQRMVPLVQAVMAENDGIYRGMELVTETP